MNPLWLVFNLVLVIELWYCLCVYSDMGPIPTDRQHHRQGLPQAEAPSVIERQSSASRRKDASTTVMLDRTSAFAFDHEKYCSCSESMSSIEPSTLPSTCPTFSVSRGPSAGTFGLDSRVKPAGRPLP
ncbi:hypothetical protein HBI56_054670 [Parastagonospora nodorum]|nr:hypothetical protein HBH52_085270 [Parastagonospora nodorum]KAH4050846.1 hypothetical protein HBH49_123960 [Parastagonospora nodorum]KAH4070177.1 hypothetical protein HBH50_095040 [Parastagonospora nodorum]KAH4090742.1 hypothetical protein HBH48_098810 [Parastagonospora nodorum]KAH4209646.1 hypothetical protein HBI95_078460 [Parastagonospora nodorum]